MEAFSRLMQKSRASLKPGSFQMPWSRWPNSSPLRCHGRETDREDFELLTAELGIAALIP